jgi:hypothetical protein
VITFNQFVIIPCIRVSVVSRLVLCRCHYAFAYEIEFRYVMSLVLMVLGHRYFLYHETSYIDFYFFKNSRNGVLFPSILNIKDSWVNKTSTFVDSADSYV